MGHCKLGVGIVRRDRTTAYGARNDFEKTNPLDVVLEGSVPSHGDIHPISAGNEEHLVEFTRDGTATQGIVVIRTRYVAIKRRNRIAKIIV
jgi:hypothetical protein